MRITEMEQDERKQRMIYSAYELFCEQGIDSVSIALIAKKSGVSANSIFRYFGTKDRLIQCTQLLLWKEIVTKLLLDSDTERSRARNGLEEIKVLIFNFQKLYELHSNYLVFACDCPIYAIFIAALEKGHFDGSISANEAASAQFFALWGVLQGYVEQIVIYDRMYEAENPWTAHFMLVLRYTLEGLAKKPSENIYSKEETKF